jgi:hypothetical protein
MTYLITILLPESSAHLAESLVQTATSFLGAAVGAVEQTTLGSYRRTTGRSGSTPEILRLVKLTAAGTGAVDAAKTVPLSRVLNATLASAGVKDGEVRVFVDTA